jgi:tryptophan synthase alpha chain
LTASRLDARFAACRAEGRAAFVAYTMAGDPDGARSLAFLKGLPAAGADVIELGFPFSDPMAEGPTIQRASLRTLEAGTTLAGVLEMVRAFRGLVPHPLAGEGDREAVEGAATRDAADNRSSEGYLEEPRRAPPPSPLRGPLPPQAGGEQDTPLILMGYLNPVLSYGYARFAADAAAAGVDGLLIVDCPPEEADELADALDAHGLALVRLAAPTTDDARLPTVVKRASGFVYYVSVAGVTGVKSAAQGTIAPAVERIRRVSGLPVAVGFGIRTPEQAAAVARVADAAVVGSALVETLEARGGGRPRWPRLPPWPQPCETRSDERSARPPRAARPAARATPARAPAGCRASRPACARTPSGDAPGEPVGQGRRHGRAALPPDLEAALG